MDAQFFLHWMHRLVRSNSFRCRKRKTFLYCKKIKKYLTLSKVSRRRIWRLFCETSAEILVRSFRTSNPEPQMGRHSASFRCCKFSEVRTVTVLRTTEGQSEELTS